MLKDFIRVFLEGKKVRSVNFKAFRRMSAAKVFFSCKKVCVESTYYCAQIKDEGEEELRVSFSKCFKLLCFYYSGHLVPKPTSEVQRKDAAAREIAHNCLNNYRSST